MLAQNVGALTGFTGSNFNGNIHLNEDNSTGRIDLLKVYIHLTIFCNASWYVLLLRRRDVSWCL
jgi:hypothetical protein